MRAIIDAIFHVFFVGVVGIGGFILFIKIKKLLPRGGFHIIDYGFGDFEFGEESSSSFCDTSWSSDSCDCGGDCNCGGDCGCD